MRELRYQLGFATESEPSRAIYAENDDAARWARRGTRATWTVVLSLVLFVSVAPAFAGVLGFIALDERIGATESQVEDLILASGGTVVFRQPARAADPATPAAVLVQLSEEEFSFLTGSPALFPYPVSYFNLKALTLSLLGHPCNAWEASVEIGSCLLEVSVFAAASSSADEAWAAVRELAGVNPPGPPVSPAIHLVPVASLQDLQEDLRVGDVLVVPPAEPSGLEPPPSPESIYYTLLPLGIGHRFTARLSVQSTRIVPFDELSFHGKKLLLARDGGAFWIFDRQNPELVVKVLNACANNGHWWVFVSGITDLGLLLQITDEATGDNFIHQTPDGTPFVPTFDVEAFACS